MGSLAPRSVLVPVLVLVPASRAGARPRAGTSTGTSPKPRTKTRTSTGTALAGQWEDHRHGRAAFRAVAGLDAAAVLLHDPLHDREPEPGAAAPLREERVEDPPDVLRPETRTGIQHRHD